jgi:hypothetical protein
MRAIARFRVFACITILAFSQTFVLAQGAPFGYTATDLDTAQVGHRVYKIDLTDPGNTVEVGLTGVGQELEGFFSIDLPNLNPTNSRLFGVAETPDGTGMGGQSILVDLTQAACSSNGTGQIVGQTFINFGTEAGAAHDFINPQVSYSVATDDLASPLATQLNQIDTTTGEAMEVSVTPDVYIDGLAFGGDGVLYGSDARISDSLYKYNFDIDQFEVVGSFNVALNEDTGLANFRGVGGTGTSLYMITEGDGANVGRLWTVNSATGAISLVPSPDGMFNGEIRLASDNSVVPEDLEGFDIPWLPLACN